jgi:hypothetical protein
MEVQSTGQMQRIENMRLEASVNAEISASAEFSGMKIGD